MEPRVPLDLRAGGGRRDSFSDVPGGGDSELSLSLLIARFKRPEAVCGEPGLLFPVFVTPSLKMWIVSVVEETARNVESRLKDMLYIVDGYVPRRNW